MGRGRAGGLPAWRAADLRAREPSLRGLLVRRGRAVLDVARGGRVRPVGHAGGGRRGGDAAERSRQPGSGRIHPAPACLDAWRGRSRLAARLAVRAVSRRARRDGPPRMGLAAQCRVRPARRRGTPRLSVDRLPRHGGAPLRDGVRRRGGGMSAPSAGQRAAHRRGPHADRDHAGRLHELPLQLLDLRGRDVSRDGAGHLVAPSRRPRRTVSAASRAWRAPPRRSRVRGGRSLGAVGPPHGPRGCVRRVSRARDRRRQAGGRSRAGSGGESPVAGGHSRDARRCRRAHAGGVARSRPGGPPRDRRVPGVPGHVLGWRRVFSHSRQCSGAGIPGT